MAKVRQFVWKIPGHRTKRKAWGFVAMRDGKQFRMFKSEWNREHAEEALAEFKLNIETPKAPVSITFAEAVERYVAAKARKKGLTEDRRILGHLGAFLGNDTPLTEITASRISEYKAHRLQTARKIGDGTRLLAGGTVNRALAALRHLLRLAHEEWEVLPAVPRIRLERESEGRLRWLTPEDAVRLLDACRASRNVDLLDLVELALFTGMRRGELLGLTWERVDRGRGVILLDGTSTKSKRRREVPLNGRADAVLARRGTRESTGTVFPSRRWDHFRTAFEAAVVRAKLIDFHFHDLRHTFASWAVQSGATPQEVKDLLGHASLAMVMRYAHLSPENLRVAVSRLDAKLPAETAAKITDGITDGVLPASWRIVSA